jgi:hypothetical protein
MNHIPSNQVQVDYFIAHEMRFDKIDDCLRAAITELMNKHGFEPVFIGNRLINYPEFYQALRGDSASSLTHPNSLNP